MKFISRPWPLLPVLIAWLVGILLLWYFHLLPNSLRWPVRLALLLVLLSGLKLIWQIGMAMYTKPRKAIFSLVAVAFGFGLPYLCIEAVSWGYLRFSAGGYSPFKLTETQIKSAESMIAGEAEYTRQDSELGWAIVPGATWTGPPSYKANMQGMRADREYPLKKSDKIIRALCFGDSFTHCNDVADDETWPFYAEQNDGMEFLNFGVGGFGMTQALLHYLNNGRSFETDVVILGCMTSDVRRSVNAYYPYRFSDPKDAPSPTGIPFASLGEDGELVLRQNPLPDVEAYRELLQNPEKRLRELAKIDILFDSIDQSLPTPFLTLIKLKSGDYFPELWSLAATRLRQNLNSVLNRKNVTIRQKVAEVKNSKFDPSQPIFKINCLIFDRFVSEVKASGAHPIILWFPRQQDVSRRRNNYELKYKPYLDHFASSNYDFFDTIDWIVADMPKDGSNMAPDRVIFAGGDKGGHFSAATNRVIGQRIADHVQKVVKRPQRTEPVTY